MTESCNEYNLPSKREDILQNSAKSISYRSLKKTDGQKISQTLIPPRQALQCLINSLSSERFNKNNIDLESLGTKLPVSDINTMYLIRRHHVFQGSHC